MYGQQTQSYLLPVALAPSFQQLRADRRLWVLSCEQAPGFDADRRRKPLILLGVGVAKGGLWLAPVHTNGRRGSLKCAVRHSF
jgi:hypothetical protein